MSTEATAANLAPTGLTRRQAWHAVLASYFGWTMDAFDFFVIVFVVDRLAHDFGVQKSLIIWTFTATLAMRPVGAFIFGVLADRYGRRKPLMANVIFFSVIELLCGFAPSYTVFLVLRTIYGIGMGGEWGVGASLAMESAPKRWRGVLSGILQSGYSMGYLLAALAARFVLPAWGWRPMFWLGGVPALLAFYIRMHVVEPEAWKQHRLGSVREILRTVGNHWKLFAYLTVLMTLFMFLSHGTQDLYPDFLKSEAGIPAARVSYLAILYNIGAIVGAVLFGLWSEKLGRRRAIVAAVFLSILVIPAWAFGNTLATLAVGAFLMQTGVQGAWGIIPAHLNELSPDSVRGLIPGLAYQLGILFASPTNSIEYALRNWLGYRWALASFEIVTIVLLAVVIMLGSEQHGKDFTTPAPS
ncbi:MAG: MFS transporter [Acidobacteriaceae bacterium]